MTGDYFVQTLRRKEQAEEDLYFAQRDRELIARLRARREGLAQAADSDADLDAPEQALQGERPPADEPQ